MTHRTNTTNPAVNTMPHWSRRAILGAAGITLGAMASRSEAQTDPADADLDAKYFPGFESKKITSNGVSIHTVIGGSGPPVLLLHGAPLSHLSWAEIAVELANDHTVIAPDLRGYGWSSKPDGGENHINYSKRTMAQDQVGVMQQLGFSSFDLAGHDLGGRVARRLTLDHPDKVESLTVLDIVPAHAHSTFCGATTPPWAGNTTYWEYGRWRRPMSKARQCRAVTIS